MKIAKPKACDPSDAASQAYTPSFYAGTVSGALQSARLVMGLLFDTYRPKSVLDVGCGQGAWLAAAEEFGCSRLVGVDGPWVDPAALLSKKVEFSTVNLEEKFRVSKRFDLCISVEVAEHLSAPRARAFVETLCAASDVILFSAAIRLQGGVNHMNEQWQSFWANLFEEAGYECHDLFRPKLWNNRNVESWYRQNILLYIKRSHHIAEVARVSCLLRGPLDIVHPEIYEGNLETLNRTIEEPSLKFCCQSFSRWGRRQLRKCLGSSKTPS